MRKISEVFKDTPVIGPYIRFEKKLLAQIAEGWDRFRHRPSLSRRAGNMLKALPLVGAAIRFPGELAEWLKDLPVAGPLAFRPAFALASFAKKTLIDTPARIVTRFVAWPLLTAGAVTAALQGNPDTISQTFNDYARDRGIDAALLDGVRHGNIRIYNSDLGVIFHGAGQQVLLTQALMQAKPGDSTLLGTFTAFASYPVQLFSMMGAVSDERNAFTLPPVGEDGTCFIRNMGGDVPPLEMLAALSGLDKKSLNADAESLARWLPLMVLGHEGRHCDNSKAGLAVRRELIEMKIALESRKAQELAVLVDERGFGMEDALRTVEEDAAIREAEREVIRKERELARMTLAGETDSDIYIVQVLERQFPGENIAAITRNARAIFPFAGNMAQSNDHATASGLEGALRQIDGNSAFDVWDAINIARELVRVGIIMGDTDRTLLGFEVTARNYQVAKDSIIPWLQARIDRTVPRGERQVRFALVLEQLQMFVNGIDALVVPEALAEATAALTASPVALPDIATPKAPALSPAP